MVGRQQWKGRRRRYIGALPGGVNAALEQMFRIWKQKTKYREVFCRYMPTMCCVAAEDQRPQGTPGGHGGLKARTARAHGALQGLKVPRLCHLGHHAHCMPLRARPPRPFRRCWKKRSGTAVTNLTAYFPQSLGRGVGEGAKFVVLWPKTPIFLTGILLLLARNADLSRPIQGLPWTEKTSNGP